MKTSHKLPKFVSLDFGDIKPPSLDSIPPSALEAVKSTPDMFVAVKDSRGNFHVIKWQTKSA